MVTDTIADFLTRVRNAQIAKHKTVTVPYSRMSEKLLSILSSEGYVSRFERLRVEGAPADSLKVFLRYDSHGAPLITQISRVSKPGRRVYVKKDDLPKVRSGLGIAIVSTSEGVLTDREARKRGVGGEVLASVF